MSGEPVFEDVETFCPAIRRQVGLSLRCAEAARGDVVSGVPVSCSLGLGCGMGVFCLLKAKRITTCRRRPR